MRSFVIRPAHLSCLARLALLGLSIAACEVHVGKDPETPAVPAVAPTAAPAAAAPVPAAATAARPPMKPTVRTIAKPRLTPGGPSAVPTAPPPVAPAAQPAAVPVINGNTPLGSGTDDGNSFKGTVYFIPDTSTKFPDVSNIKPTAVLFAKELNIAPRDFKDGFPGVDARTEWFAIRYESPLTVATEADYTFRVVSDDGALIYIDNTLILDNDGIHPPTEKKAVAHLVVGTHQIRIDYWQGPKYQIALQAFVSAPNVTEHTLTPKL